ncbi:HlyD family secretion protein [Propionispira arboris]|uniref:HlyD family secretion protein n=1 Tax=Propionispira arboris TaxID=84035 RepID=A0A1H7A1C8_9FIRM|nr:HlyD family efflux transporter periplasmic adaptor subunit [Propionispira arboris]SEJ59503.1 HlyD family secretion protein [Propionispira arboris]
MSNFWKIRVKQITAVVVSGLLLITGFAGCGKNTTYITDGELWGRADAKEIDVNTKISGRVVKLNVKEGDVVTKGQVIARIDSRDLEAQVAQAEANIAALEAQYTQATAQTGMQTGTAAAAVGQSGASQESAEASMNLARADYDRYKELLEAGAVSKQIFETYRTKYETAQAAYRQASASVSSAQAGLDVTSVNEANENAVIKKIDQAKASLEQIHVSLDETIIRAPFDGVITEKYVEEGSMLSTGTPLVAVQDTNDNWVNFKVAETSLNHYNLYQKITIEGRDGKTQFTGTITDISKKSEFATRRATSERGDASDIISFNVKVQVNSGKLRPGMRFRIMEAAK